MAEYFKRGVSKVLWLTTGEEPSDKDAPTQSELNAGDDITALIGDISGFEFDNSPIPTPDLSSTFTTTISGEDVAQTPTIEFYDDDGTPSPDFRTLMAKGNAGFLALLPAGQGSGERSDIWSVTSTGVNDLWTTGNEAAKTRIGFAVTAVPNLSGTQGA